MRRAGVQTEVLAHLALAMVLATFLLSAVWVARHEATLRGLLGRALLAEARVARPPRDVLFPGTEWWIVAAGGARPRGPVAGPPDGEAQALAARAAAEGQPLLRMGAPWEAVRFAAPVGPPGEVAVARLPRQASLRMRAGPLLVGAGVLAADALIFTAFGAAVLRRRVVLPFQRLAEAARALAAGEPMRMAVEGPREAAEVAAAWNDMSDALDARTSALRKAVVELRTANEDLRRARAGLARAERLAAVGRLAAGVAHEVGNPIGAILAFQDLAGRDPGLSEAGRRHLERAAREGERVRTILRQLLDFSRPPRPAPGPVALDHVVAQTLELLGAQPRYAAIRFEVERDPATPPARGDAGLCAQILLNLLLNAADAVAGVEGPRVLLRMAPAVRRVRRGEAPEESPPRRRPDAVACVVADNGRGIAEGDRERVFDPFFTTKPAGEGTGLGLANAVRLAEEQDGHLELVEPPEGFRTAFALTLPSVGEAGDGNARPS